MEYTASLECMVLLQYGWESVLTLHLGKGDHVNLFILEAVLLETVAC